MNAYVTYPLKAGVAALAISAALVTTAAAQQAPFTGGDPSKVVTSGGVGLEARAQLAQHEREANLKLVFTEPQGSYLSDIAVQVFDHNGSMVLDTTSNGPWLLAKLSPGNYRIVASDQGARQEHRVSVGQGLKIMHIRMPDQGGITGRPTAG